MTRLDDLRAAMDGDPRDDAARLRWYGALAQADLVLWLAAEAGDGMVEPEVLALPEGRFVLAFTDEARLAAFAERPVPYAALPGRVIAEMLAGQGLGLAVDAATFLPPAAVDWLAGLLAGTPEAAEAAPALLMPPDDVPAALAAAIAGVIGQARVAGAWLVGTSEGRALVIVAGAGAAEADLARALREAVVFSGAGAGVDVAFLAPDAPAVAAAARVGMALAPASVPAPAAPPAPPGSDPARPPRLR